MYVAYAATASNVSASLGARLLESLVIMIIGMGAVFLMLTISMFGMMLIGKIASPREELLQERISMENVLKGRQSAADDSDADIAAAIAVIHHIRRKTLVNIPLINRKDI